MIFWDTSALLPLLIAESDTPRRRTQLEQDPRMAVWWATTLECESALQRRVRDGSLSPADHQRARARLQILSVSWQEVPPSAELRQLASRLIRTHPLRAADACQLAAALLLATGGIRDLRFACADHRLNHAAAIENIRIDF